ncbi:MAG TPA: hypothetical protein PKC22_11530 [Rhodocyclaceae bacterium]|nr:hypothetical protein [Rhodocyclaceae bacterium]
MNTLTPNDRGGLTYASPQRIGCVEQRADYLGPVRECADALDQLVAAVRRAWPKPYPIPPEVDMLLRYHSHALDLLRDGRLRKLAEVCNASD